MNATQMTELHDGSVASAETDTKQVWLRNLPQEMIMGLVLWAIGSVLLGVVVGRILRALGQDVPTLNPPPPKAIISEGGKPPSGIQPKPDTRPN